MPCFALQLWQKCTLDISSSFCLLCRCPVHLPHLPPGEPSRSSAGDGEWQLLPGPLEADRLHAASAPQRRPVWKLHGSDPLPVWLLRLLRGIQHHFLRWERSLLPQLFDRLGIKRARRRCFHHCTHGAIRKGQRVRGCNTGRWRFAWGGNLNLANWIRDWPWPFNNECLFQKGYQHHYESTWPVFGSQAGKEMEKTASALSFRSRRETAASTRHNLSRFERKSQRCFYIHFPHFQSLT